MATICNIDVELFARRPSPQELAVVVAEWHDQQQADFFIALGEELRNRCNGKPFMQWQAIATAIVKTEEELCDGSASQFFREIQSRLEKEDV